MDFLKLRERIKGENKRLEVRREELLAELSQNTNDYMKNNRELVDAFKTVFPVVYSASIKGMGKSPYREFFLKKNEMNEYSRIFNLKNPSAFQLHTNEVKTDQQSFGDVMYLINKYF